MRTILLTKIACLLMVFTIVKNGKTPFPEFDFGPAVHPVISAKGWTTSQMPYQWLPDGRLLVWRGEYMTDSMKATLCDPQTGKQDPLVAFNQKFHTHTSESQISRIKLVPSAMILSPDGQCVMWFETRMIGMAGPRVWRSLRLDGSMPIVEQTPFHMHVLTPAIWEWKDNYHGWTSLAMAAGDVVVFHVGLAHPEDVHPVTLQSKALPEWTQNAYQYQFKGLAPTGEGIFLGTGVQDKKTLRQTSYVSLVDITTGTKPVHTFTLSMPSEASVFDYTISPSGDQIAWLLRLTKPHALRGITRKFVTDEIWVSGLDGSNLHRLGYQVIRDVNRDWISFLSWKNNNRLNFICKQTLYEVQVNKE